MTKITDSTAQVGTDDGTKPAQKRGRRTEAERTAEIAASLPAGIQLGAYTDGRGKPWYVRYGQERRVKSFAAESERNDFAETLAAKREEQGAGVLDVDLGAWAQWQAFRKRCPAPLDELERLWARHTAAQGLTVENAVAVYMARWKGTEPAFRHVRLHLKRLREEFGALALDAVTPELLKEFNERLVDPKTGLPMAEVTKFDHRKNWNGFFEHCVLARLTTFNPCDLFVLPTPGEQERDILTARQIFDLLAANREQPVVGRLAFELFGGLRASSAARLTPEHVKRESKGVRLPGAAHKSGKVKFRQGHPAALWAWYDHASPALWEVRTGSYDERKTEAFIRARVENPGNVLRNSFATYLLAATNNPPAVARLMQHTSLKMLEIYEGVATEADAALVLAMTPAAVAGTWEQFLAAPPKV